MSSSRAESAASPAASMLRPGRPVTSQATNAGGVVIRAPTAVARVSVFVGSPLTLTITFHVPWKAAATSARTIAIVITGTDRGAGAQAAGRVADRPLGC